MAFTIRPRNGSDLFYSCRAPHGVAIHGLLFYGCTTDARIVCVFRVMSLVGDWLSTGGLYITAGCLASVITLVVVLTVAVCLVRARLRRRRRRKMLPATTKIELQETSSGEPAPPVHDPLLAGEMGQLSESDVTLTEFESEPVRYVVGHNIVSYIVDNAKFLSSVMTALRPIVFHFVVDTSAVPEVTNYRLSCT